MLEKLAVFRAVSSYFALSLIKRLTIVTIVILAILTGGVWALAHYLSSWWWLLIIPVIVIAIVFFVIRGIAALIARKIYSAPLSTEQKSHIIQLTDKIERLLEQRQTTPFLLAIVSIKDLLMYRELRTIIQIVQDSKSLRADFKELEAKLQLKDETK